MAATKFIYYSDLMKRDVYKCFYEVIIYYFPVTSKITL